MSDSERKFLQDIRYYEDLYDKFTVEKCRSYDKKESPFNDFFLYFIKGERFAKKEGTIQKWMEEDRKREEHYNRIHISSHRCNECGYETELFDKELVYSHTKNKKDYVQFTFGCKRCKILYTIDESRNVKKEKTKPNLCPQCKGEIKCKIEKQETQTIFQDYCTQCDWKDPEPLINTHFDLISEEEKETLERDKAKYLMTTKEGLEYEKCLQALDTLHKLQCKQEDEKKEGTPYNKLAKLEKLNIAQLKKKLSKILEENQFAGLSFENPIEEKGDLIVTFTIQDDSPERTQYDSIKIIKKLLTQSLENTNWLTMSDGIHYKMGVLSGGLRGIEGEEKLLELIKKTREESFKENILT